MKTLLFAPETLNIAEMTRMIEIARTLRDRYECVFCGYGGEYEHLIQAAGFTLLPLEPRLTDEKVRHLWEVDRMESFADPFSYGELARRVESETALLKHTGAAAVVMGFTLSFALSARIAGSPLIYVMPFPMTEPFLRAGLVRWPEQLDVFPVNLLPRRFLDRAASAWLLRTRLWIRPFRRLAREYGLEGCSRLMDIFQGDYNLVTDLPEITGVEELPRNWRYVGFIFARLDAEIPDFLKERDTARPLVYCAMGSSANRDLLLRVLESFSGLDCDVVSPMKRHLAGLEACLPPNVRLCDWLPAHLVNPMADLAVIHGGQGTVQTAAASGKPFIGIGLQPEQEANIDLMVRFESAIRLRKRDVGPESIGRCVREILENPVYAENARRLKALADSRDGAAESAACIDRILRGEGL